MCLQECHICGIDAVPFLGHIIRFNSQAVALYKSVLEYKTNWKITINIDAWGNELPKNCLGVKGVKQEPKVPVIQFSPGKIGKCWHHND